MNGARHYALPRRFSPRRVPGPLFGMDFAPFARRNPGQNQANNR